eukprot:scaffold86862_cov38-Prasinocladus_malaysianus.AAC.2
MLIHLHSSMRRPVAACHANASATVINPAAVCIYVSSFGPQPWAVPATHPYLLKCPARAMKPSAFAVWRSCSCRAIVGRFDRAILSKSTTGLLGSQSLRGLCWAYQTRAGLVELKYIHIPPIRLLRVCLMSHHSYMSNALHDKVAVELFALQQLEMDAFFRCYEKAGHLAKYCLIFKEFTCPSKSPPLNHLLARV